MIVNLRPISACSMTGYSVYMQVRANGTMVSSMAYDQVNFEVIMTAYASLTVNAGVDLFGPALLNTSADVFYALNTLLPIFTSLAIEKTLIESFMVLLIPELHLQYSGTSRTVHLWI